MVSMAMSKQDAGQQGQVSELWKSVALFLAGAVISLGGVWATSVRDAVTRKDVETMMETQTPYSRDKSGIEAKLSQIQSAQSQMSEDMRKLSDRLGGRK